MNFLTENTKMVNTTLAILLIVGLFYLGSTISEKVVQSEISSEEVFEIEEMVIYSDPEPVVSTEDTLVEVVVIPPVEHQSIHFTEDGILKVSDTTYDNFSDAFGFAKAMLGDSSRNGKLKVFVWKGKKYNTESMKDPSLTVK